MTTLFALNGRWEVAEGTWSLAEAKARFSEVVDLAEREGPQHLTKHGREAAVVLSAKAFRELQPGRAEPAKSLLDIMLDPRFRLLSDEEHDAIFARDPDPGRVIEL